MSNDVIPRLCGGTFFTQILESRKETKTRRARTQGESDVIHNKDVLFALLQIIQPDAYRPGGTTFETYTARFKTCAGEIGSDLKFKDKNVITAFKKRMDEDYTTVLNEMANFCNDYIDARESTQKHVLLVKRLIELIRDDNDEDGIDAEQMFKVTADSDSSDEIPPSAVIETPTQKAAGAPTSHIVANMSKTLEVFAERLSSVVNSIEVTATVNAAAATEQVAEPPAVEGERCEVVPTDAAPKRITVNNYGTVENQKFISVETMNGDINL
jgi:hypothetical protein